MPMDSNHLLRRTLSDLAPVLRLLFGVSAVGNLAVILASIYNMELYNRVLNTRNLTTLEALTWALVVVVVCWGALEYLRSRLYHVAAGRVLHRLSLPTLLGAAELADPASAADQPIRDLNELRGFIAGPSLGVLFDLAWTPLFLVALFAMHWAYGAYALACAAVIVLLNLLAEAVAKRPLAEASAATVRSFAEIATAVRHAEAVEAMGMFPAMAGRWRYSQAAMLDLVHLGLRRAKALTAATKAFRALVTGGMVALGLVMCLNGWVSAGSMLAGNLMLARMLLPFERLVGSWRQWVMARAAWNRIAAVLAAPRRRRGSMALPCREGRVEVERRSYLPPGADRPVIRNVSFALAPGEMLGIVGPSAAGKSTLGRLMLGILEPSAGGVYLDGHSTWLWEREDFGHYVGFLPQRVSLVEGTVAENIGRLRDGPLSEVVTAARMAGIHEMIAALPRGYDTPLSDHGYGLSGGQRQRIGLARALYGGPRLLVLDEPGASLDQPGEEALVAAMAAARRCRTTVVVITHRPAIAAAADRLLVLRDGMVDRLAPPTAMAAGVLAASAPAMLARATS
ncbi:MAG: type I secretion system permease/ATPase [Magnetospirillum sp.]|nr:type I secretion system permease/ATPase [Magnetospirillum sp.]